MKKNIFFTIAFSIIALISACNSDNNKDDNQEEVSSDELVKAEGGKYYGGVLKVNSLDTY